MAKIQTTLDPAGSSPSIVRVPSGSIDPRGLDTGAAGFLQVAGQEVSGALQRAAEKALIAQDAKLESHRSRLITNETIEMLRVLHEAENEASDPEVDPAVMLDVFGQRTAELQERFEQIEDTEVRDRLMLRLTERSLSAESRIRALSGRREAERAAAGLDNLSGVLHDQVESGSATVIDAVEIFTEEANAKIGTLYWSAEEAQRAISAFRESLDTVEADVIRAELSEHIEQALDDRVGAAPQMQRIIDQEVITAIDSAAPRAISKESAARLEREYTQRAANQQFARDLNDNPHLTLARLREDPAYVSEGGAALRADFMHEAAERVEQTDREAESLQREMQLVEARAWEVQIDELFRADDPPDELAVRELIQALNDSAAADRISDTQRMALRDAAEARLQELNRQRLVKQIIDAHRGRDAMPTIGEVRALSQQRDGLQALERRDAEAIERQILQADVARSEAARRADFLIGSGVDQNFTTDPAALNAVYRELRKREIPTDRATEMFAVNGEGVLPSELVSDLKALADPGSGVFDLGTLGRALEGIARFRGTQEARRLAGSLDDDRLAVTLLDAIADLPPGDPRRTSSLELLSDPEAIDTLKEAQVHISGRKGDEELKQPTILPLDADAAVGASLDHEQQALFHSLFRLKFIEQRLELGNTQPRDQARAAAVARIKDRITIVDAPNVNYSPGGLVSTPTMRSGWFDGQAAVDASLIAEEQASDYGAHLGWLGNRWDPFVGDPNGFVRPGSAVGDPNGVVYTPVVSHDTGEIIEFGIFDPANPSSRRAITPQDSGFERLIGLMQGRLEFTAPIPAEFMHSQEYGTSVMQAFDDRSNAPLEESIVYRFSRWGLLQLEQSGDLVGLDDDQARRFLNHYLEQQAAKAGWSAVFSVRPPSSEEGE